MPDTPKHETGPEQSEPETEQTVALTTASAPQPEAGSVTEAARSAMQRRPHDTGYHEWGARVVELSNYTFGDLTVPTEIAQALIVENEKQQPLPEDKRYSSTSSHDMGRGKWRVLTNYLPDDTLEDEEEE